MSQAAREKAQASRRALRERRTEVAEWYGGLKSSSDTAWDEIKEGFARAYEALAKSWDEALQAFDS